jgi:hypothetical protein
MESMYPDLQAAPSSFEWGMIQGKLSALSWALGNEWDDVDIGSNPERAETGHRGDQLGPNDPFSIAMHLAVALIREQHRKGLTVEERLDRVFHTMWIMADQLTDQDYLAANHLTEVFLQNAKETCMQDRDSHRFDSAVYRAVGDQPRLHPACEAPHTAD